MPVVRQVTDTTFAWLREVDGRFSTYRPESELSCFDRGELPFADLSTDVRAVLDRCAEFWGETDGYRSAGRWTGGYRTGRCVPAGREPAGRDPPGREPAGRVPAQRYHRIRPGRPPPPAARATSSLAMSTPG